MIDILKISKKISENSGDIEIKFNEGGCLKNFKFSRCKKCVSICPENTIKVKENKLVYDQRECSSCALCVSVCPNEAFYTVPTHLKILYKRLNQDKATIISCFKSGQNEGLKFNCLGALSKGDLLTAATKTSGAILIKDSCKECKYSIKALPLLEENVSLLNNLFESIPINREIIFSDKPLLTEKFFTRSDFLKNVGKEAVDIGLSSLFAKNDKKNVMPEKRFLLFTLIKNKEMKTKEKMPLPFFHLSLNSECDFCLRCEKFCPTKAISLNLTNKKAQLIFESLRCSGCRLCIDACPKKCLQINRVDSNNFSNKPITLTESTTNRCKDCGSLIFDSKDKVCTSCKASSSLKENVEKIFD